MWFGDKVLTHGQIRLAAYAWARRLLEQGFVPGDRIGLLAENSPFFIAAYLGVIRAGLCVVPFPVDCGEKTFERIAAATGMKRVLISARFRPRWNRSPIAWTLRWKTNLPPRPPRPMQQFYFPPIDPRRDLAAIMLTSGSTGEAKGVMVTHRNIQSQHPRHHRVPRPRPRRPRHDRAAVLLLLRHVAVAHASDGRRRRWC